MIRGALRYDSRAWAEPIITTRSASRAARLSRSAAEAASTDSMPSARATRVIRTASSPRFAISTRVWAVGSDIRLDVEQWLVEFNELGIGDEQLANGADHAGAYCREKLHDLDETYLGILGDGLADRDKRGCAGLRRVVERAEAGGADRNPMCGWGARRGRLSNGCRRDGDGRRCGTGRHDGRMVYGAACVRILRHEQVDPIAHHAQFAPVAPVEQFDQRLDVILRDFVHR